MFKHFLVPTDGSELSQKAVVYAADVAKAMGARITALYVKPPHQLTQSGEGFLNDLLAPDMLAQRTERLAHQYLEDAEKACQAAGVPCHKLTADSHAPFQAIIDAASSQGCDLILMASHARAGLGGLIIGSETKKVLAHTSLPVLVYR